MPREVQVGNGVALASLALAVWSIAHPTEGIAQVGYGFRVGAGVSDNISRVASEEVQEGIATAGVEISWSEVRRRLRGDVAADLRYFDYLDDTFESRIAGTADASLAYHFLPDVFSWTFQDSFGQGQSDPFAVPTPDTLENINYLSTGPQLNFRLGDAGLARMFGRYSVRQYERSALDGDSTSGGFAVGRALSTSSEVLLNGAVEDIKFDDVADADYRRQSAYLSYALDGSRTDATIQLGYTWLEPVLGEDADGALVSIELVRALSPAATLSLSVGSQLTDSSDALRAVSEASTIGSRSVTATSAPFETRFASVSWEFRKNRTGMNAGVSRSDDVYEVQAALDRVRTAYDLQIDRQLSSALGVQLSATYVDEVFRTSGLTSKTLYSGLTATWRFGARIGLEASFEHLDREATASIGDYVEDRIFVSIVYRAREFPR